MWKIFWNTSTTRYTAFGQNADSRFLTFSVYIYHRALSNSSFAATLRYDPEHNLTIGYVILGPYIELEDFRKAVELQFVHITHPLLIPILLTELGTQFRVKRLIEIHMDLRIIEEQSGFGAWTVTRPVKGSSSQNYREWAREIGTLDSRCAFIEADVQSSLLRVDFTMKEIQAMRDYIPAEKFQKLKGAAIKLVNRVEFLESNLRHMLVYGGTSKRLRAQQNVVNNDRSSDSATGWVC